MRYMPEGRPCDCGSGLPDKYQYGFDKISPICRTCPECHDKKMALKYKMDPVTRSYYVVKD
jgi:hypothetical protein